MSFLVENHLYIMIAMLVGLILLPTEYRKKKSLLTLMCFLAFSIGYELLTNKSVTTIPSQINRALNQKAPDKSENVKYYKDPEENL